MIQAEVGDITQAKTEAIVNAANGIGILGAGVAGAIRREGGYEIQNEAKQICKQRKNVDEGSFYVTGAGQLSKNGVQKIYHAVTMKYPGGLTSLFIVDKVLREVLEDAVKNKVKSIAIPGLGTGIGGLDKETVADIMAKIGLDYSLLLDIYFIDMNHDFINQINKTIGFDNV
jgi:O-acetyl-ADP-ribose deacetylase (regulator of RNase III)